MTTTDCHDDHDFDLCCEECVREVMDQVQRSGRRVADALEDVDDVVGETLLSIVASASRGKGWRRGQGATLRTWTHRVTFNSFIDTRRRAQRLRQQGEVLGLQRVEPLPDPLQRVEYDLAIEGYLERIPERDANGVRLFLFEGQSKADLARLLGLTPQRWGQIVKKHLEQIHEILDSTDGQL